METTIVGALIIAIYGLVELAKHQRAGKAPGFTEEDRVDLKETCALSRALDTRTRRLLEMHEHPEKTGFGTVGFQDVIERNTAAVNNLNHVVKSLIHYVEWLSTTTTGKAPPPHIDKEG